MTATTHAPAMNTVASLPTLPAVVEGRVTHSRRSPLQHAFGLPVFLWLVDVDHLPKPPLPLRPFVSFRAADHLGDPRGTLRQNVEHFLAAHGMQRSGGRIVMLANARVLGHVFDPLTVFWCFDPDGTCQAVVAEVHNTYGERHAYLLTPDEYGRAATEKQFYVSPFNDVSGDYELGFALSPEQVSTSVVLRRQGQVVFGAGFTGIPTPATTARVAALQLRRPLMPQRVSLLIRVHGLWLWLRRLPIAHRPHHRAPEGV